MRFELERHKFKIPKDDLNKDLKKVAKKRGSERLNKLANDQEGKFSSNTYLKKFGSWHNALKVPMCKPGRVSEVKFLYGFMKLTGG